MSYPYTSFNLDAERAHQRLVRSFQSERDQHADSPSGPTKSAPVAGDQKDASKRPSLSSELLGLGNGLSDLAKDATLPKRSGWTKRDMRAFGFTLTVLLLGTIAAANTNRPVFWLLIGPAPIAAGFTVLRYIRKRLRWRIRYEERIYAAPSAGRKLTVPTDGPS